MRRSAALLAAAMILAVSPATAQEAGTVEIGGFFQMTRFDEPTTLTDTYAQGVGGFLGVFLAPNLALEAGASRNWTEDASPAGVDGTWTPLRGRLVYAIPASDRIYPLIGAGVVHNIYSDAVDGNDTGVMGLVGLKGYLTDRVALRTDLQADYMWSPFNEGDAFQSTVVSEHINWSLSGGLSIDLGRGRARDRDRDGVRDRNDLCLDTPLGVGVDSGGCRLDRDRDGVYDEDDACPSTPAAARVDVIGCRVDTDGDGIFDEEDRCAATPTNVGVDARGCRVDADRDGIFDEDDRCAATPVGARVDASGCRLDGDVDGVYDEDDQCPNSAPGDAVDVRGCPVLFAPEETTLVLEGVTFETSSTELTVDARTILNLVANALVANPEVRVRVNGHTDSIGLRAYNTELSQGRAESVMRYLIGRGVNAGRLEARGFGPDRPAATNSTPEGRQLNRRVELERIN